MAAEATACNIQSQSLRPAGCRNSNRAHCRIQQPSWASQGFSELLDLPSVVGGGPGDGEDHRSSSDLFT